jgi:uncharacterized protein YuzE
MTITETIKMLEEEKEKHGDIEVWIEEDRGIRPVEIYKANGLVIPEYDAGPPQRIFL